MKRWAACVLVSAGGLAGTVCAQDRVDGSAPGAPPVVSKPAPSRYYGTARPPGAPGAPPAAAPLAPPPSVRPPAGGPPPAVYSNGYRPRPPAPSSVRHDPPPRVGVDIVVGTTWPRPVHPAYPVYPAYPYWYGPRYYGPRYPYPVYGYPPAVVVQPPVVVSPPPPVVYVERPPEPAAPMPGYWYWCADPQGWYPDVGDCPGGWQPVPPRADR